MKRGYYLGAAAIIAIAVVIGLAMYPSLPPLVPTHWDAQGRANGFSSRTTAVLVMPIIMIVVSLIFAALPWLSPKKFEVNGIGRHPVYLQILLVLLSFMTFMHYMTLSAGEGRHVDITTTVIGGICLLFAVMGVFMVRLKRNFFVGVRTPWTLADERVWDATHRVASWTFTIGGALGLILALAGTGMWPAFVLVMSSGIVPVIYSLVYYKQLERRGEV